MNVKPHIGLYGVLQMALRKNITITVWSFKYFPLRRRPVFKYK
jgi:hypothetical protein